MDLSEAKAALRRRMRELRAAIPPEHRAELAARVEEHLFAEPAVREARNVMLFYSFGSEIPTRVMSRRLLAEGRRVLLPYLDAAAMEAGEVRAGEPLTATAYGPKEPAHRVAVDPGQIDVVMTPGLAFDRQGRRLGYGRGYYDRFLRRLSPHALRVAIAFAVQVVDEVPADPGDERVDLIVTEDGIIRCEQGGSRHTPPYT